MRARKMRFKRFPPNRTYTHFMCIHIYINMYVCIIGIVYFNNNVVFIPHGPSVQNERYPCTHTYYYYYTSVRLCPFAASNIIIRVLTREIIILYFAFYRTQRDLNIVLIRPLGELRLRLWDIVSFF